MISLLPIIVYSSVFYNLRGSLNKFPCDNTPLGPVLINFFEQFCLGDSSSGSDRGIIHFFMATRIQPREWEKKNKEQTNNKGLGQLKEQEEEFCNTAFPVHLYTNADVYFLRNFFKLLRMPTHLWPSSSLLTVVDCPYASPFANCLLWVPFINNWVAFHCPLPVSSKISSSGLCSVSRQNRQRDRLLSGPPT